MAQPTIQELERQWAASFAGRTVTVALTNSTAAVGEPLLSAWLANEVSGNGYSRFTAPVTGGDFDAVKQAATSDLIAASFQCTGPSPISYRNVVVFLNGETIPYSVYIETSNIVIPPGNVQSYSLTLEIGF